MSNEVVKEDVYHKGALIAAANFADKARRIDMSRQNHVVKSTVSTVEDENGNDDDVLSMQEKGDRAVEAFKDKARRVDMSKQTHTPEESPETKLAKIAKNYNEAADRVYNSRKPSKVDISTVNRVENHLRRNKGVSRLEQLEQERTERFKKLYGY